MALLTTLMMIKAGADMLQGLQTMQGAGRQAKLQKDILEKRKTFNLKQLEQAYQLSYKGLMRNYAEARQGQLEQATKGIKDTNTQISARARNVNLTESSFKGDIDNEMDFALIENVNTMLLNQENDVNSLVSQNFAQQFALEQNYQDSLRNINNTEQQQKQVGFAQLLGGSLSMYQGLEQRQLDIESTTEDKEISKGVKYIRNFGDPINPMSRLGTSMEIKARRGVFERMGKEWLK